MAQLMEALATKPDDLTGPTDWEERLPHVVL